MNIDTATRADLECEILDNDELYKCFDENKLMKSIYTTEELRDIVRQFVLDGDECGVVQCLSC